MSERQPFDAFFHCHHGRRVRLVAKKIADFHHAEDLVLEAFFELGLKWDGAENPEAFLTTIVNRKISKYLHRRSQNREIVAESSPETVEAYVGFHQTPDPAITVERRDTIRRAAARMTPFERRLASDRAQQFTTREIAERYGVSRSKVGLTERRMHHRLSEMFDEPTPGDRITSLHKGVRLLPLRQREVMTLALNDVRPEQIATRLGITPNNARVNLWHARRTLRQVLTDGGQLDLLIADRQALTPWELTERVINSTMIFGAELPLSEHAQIEWHSLDYVSPLQASLDRLAAMAYPQLHVLSAEKRRVPGGVDEIKADRYSWESADDVLTRVRDLIEAGNARELLKYLSSSPRLTTEKWVRRDPHTFHCGLGVAIDELDRYLTTCEAEARTAVEADRRLR